MKWKIKKNHFLESGKNEKNMHLIAFCNFSQKLLEFLKPWKKLSIFPEF